MKPTSPSQTLLLLFAAVVLYVQAQDAAANQTHIITVGKAAHRFDPESITANVGDIVEFQFYPTNHSVVRSSFDYPCIPFDLVVPVSETFFSGFKPVKTIQKDPPSFKVTVNDTEPIYFYCSAPDSCDHWGMVGVVNPQNDSALALHRNKAMKASFVLQPGDPWPSEAQGNTEVLPSPTNAPTGTTSSPIVTITANPSASPSNSDKSSAALSPSAIAAVALGGAALVALICGLFFFLGRKRPQHYEPPPVPTIIGGSEYGEKPSTHGSVLMGSPMPQLHPPIPQSPTTFDQSAAAAAIRASYGSSVPFDSRYSRDYMGPGSVGGDPSIYYPPLSTSPPLMGMGGGLPEEVYKSQAPSQQGDGRPVEIDSGRLTNQANGPPLPEREPVGGAGELFLDAPRAYQAASDTWSSSTAAAPAPGGNATPTMNPKINPNPNPNQHTGPGAGPIHNPNPQHGY